MPRLNGQHDGRRKNATYYNEHLKTVKTPTEKDGNWMIYNQYTVRTEKRDALIDLLNNFNIGNAIYYPLPLHSSKMF